ncbi:hypothetical protein BB2000_0792 [Proteus mirabilis BB2000]|nr:hypothetical protein BB2000_0792 [Proteus mirabilis BB2000]
MAFYRFVCNIINKELHSAFIDNNLTFLLSLLHSN